MKTKSRRINPNIMNIRETNYRLTLNNIADGSFIKICKNIDSLLYNTVRPIFDIDEILKSVYIINDKIKRNINNQIKQYGKFK